MIDKESSTDIEFELCCGINGNKLVAVTLLKLSVQLCLDYATFAVRLTIYFPKHADFCLLTRKLQMRSFD